jgi:Na+/H+ antiporter NhaD/arsenite permease-like protein
MTPHPHPAMVIPFLFLLLCIAVVPFFAGAFWGKHYHHVAFALALIVVIYYLTALKDDGGGPRLLETLVDYVGFIALVGSLYTIAGGIHIDLYLKGTPFVSTCVLAVGAVFSNLVGTTGASMLLVRPFLRINRGMLREYHVVFFIFIVSNVGGVLTPLGDPPLFLGYLKGVPFFWLLQRWQIVVAWLFSVVSLLIMFYCLDRFRCYNANASVQAGNGEDSLQLDKIPEESDVDALVSSKGDGADGADGGPREIVVHGNDDDDDEGHDERPSNGAAGAGEDSHRHSTMPSTSVLLPEGRKDTYFSQVDRGTLSISGIGRLTGALNFAWLAMIVFLVLIQEADFVRSMEENEWCDRMGKSLGWTGTKAADLVITLIIASLMALTAVLSFFLGSIRSMHDNEFSFGPLKEVAFLFVGIFATMIPALDLLTLDAESFGFKTPAQFYWGSGALSSVLDNAPTYLNFMTAAMGNQKLSLENSRQVMDFVSDPALMKYCIAVSLGSVFFGANTYIGNGPNMMVKSIAEASGAPCPTFFAYIYRYTLPFLMPVLVVVCFAFVY